MNNFIYTESPVLFAGAIAAILFGRKVSKKVPIVAAVVLLFMLYFYRMPNITIKIDDSYLLSPGYGTISRILHTENNRVLITIFLSPFNIHAQYFPCSGVVLNQIYDDTGRFEIASDAYKSDKNEKVITALQTPRDIVTITQIAGILVRRISSPNKIGSHVEQGDYLGFIKFGSRVDIEFSLQEYDLLDTVYVGSILNGPDTKIAVLKNI
jgi:phosphatidylserine decarboxylase